MPKTNSRFISIDDSNTIQLEKALENKSILEVHGKHRAMHYMISFKEIGNHLHSLIAYKFPGEEVKVIDCYPMYGKKFPMIPGGEEVNRKIKNIYTKMNRIYEELKVGVS